MEELQTGLTVEDLNERIQQAEVRGDAGVMIALVMQRQELLDSQREIVETDDQSYADPLAAEVAAKCGVVSDDQRPPDKPDTRTTREIAAAARRTTIADREAPDESDTPAAALDDGYAALNTAIALNDGEAMKKALLQIEEADQPDQPDDPLAAAVNRRLRRKDNTGRSNFGLLPRPTQSKE